jgi:predicted nicotinamide N-methyase
VAYGGARRGAEVLELAAYARLVEIGAVWAGLAGVGA